MELMEGLLDSGRTIYTDNWYTSVSLAKRLIDRKTHLVGTIRANRKGNPQEVIKEKLNRGGIVARQDNDKTVVLKWKDKRDAITLSTKHDDSTVTLAKKGKEVIKPKVIVNYNQGKAFIDLSDQMSAYAPCLRRTSKWYKRLVFHLITATTIVNALHLYKKKISITTFKEEVVSGLIENDEKLNTVSRPSTSRTQRCTLKEVEGQKRVTRKRCTMLQHHVNGLQCCVRPKKCEKGQYNLCTV
ncbi:piggyBac transposable element-derived protein 4-like [Anthonomus grandis grandis]|uniref:piggyBac transposable element-derived protein 4-like n=1 Tax=Anthonomus grandis grandis TaxID=2921223 RepID=UPI002166B712|nr:piggyBac transposable element-derived protein 4-like [Anthonomus grandis grandis]